MMRMRRFPFPYRRSGDLSDAQGTMTDRAVPSALDSGATAAIPITIRLNGSNPNAPESSGPTPNGIKPSNPKPCTSKCLGRLQSSLSAHLLANQILTNQIRVIAAAALACANLIGVYGDSLAWTKTTITATLCGCLVSLAARIVWPRHKRALAFLLAVICQLVLGPMMVTGSVGIPSAGFIIRGWSQSVASFKYLVSAQPPVGADSTALLAVWTLALWCAFLASQATLPVPAATTVARSAVEATATEAPSTATGTSPTTTVAPSTVTGVPSSSTTPPPAVTPSSPAPLFAIVPVFLTFVASALLGTSEGWHNALVGALALMIMFPWFPACNGGWNLRRHLAATMVLALAITAGWCACATLPQHRLAVRDHYDPPVMLHDHTSPLSTLRSYVRNHRDETVLTARGLPAGMPVRMAVMTCFDGNVWNIAGCTDGGAPVTYHGLGTDDRTPRDGETTVTFTAEKTLAGSNWLPIAGVPRSVAIHTAGDGVGAAAGTGTEPDSVSTGSAGHGVFYHAETNSAVYPAGMPDRLTYTVIGPLTALPSDAEIASAKATSPKPASLKDVPGAIGTLAASVAGGQDTGGETAQALAKWLHAEGWFSHGSSDEHPSLAGHGSHRIAAMLSGEGMVGDSEQYASLMALMAQTLGLNSRVVFGFIPKGDDGTLSDARSTRVDGQPVTEFTGNDVEAWTEIEFEALGWVAFFPTPPETKTTDDASIASSPNTDHSVHQAPAPLTEPPREEPSRPTGAPASGADEGTDERERPWHSILRGVGIIMLWLSPVWLFMIVVAAMVLRAKLRLRMARNRGTPRDRLVAGWLSLTNLAQYGGLLAQLPYATRRMQAVRLCDRFPDCASIIRILAEQADHAAFSGDPVSVEEVQSYWRSVDQVRAHLLASLPRRIRWLLPIMPFIPFIPVGSVRTIRTD